MNKLAELINLKKHLEECSKSGISFTKDSDSILLTNRYDFSLILSYAPYETGKVYLDSQINNGYGVPAFYRDWEIPSESKDLEEYIWKYCIPVMENLSGPFSITVTEEKEIIKNVLNERKIDFGFIEEKEIEMIYGCCKPLVYHDIKLSFFQIEEGTNKFGIGVRKTGEIVLFELEVENKTRVNYYWYELCNIRNTGEKCVEEIVNNFIDTIVYRKV